MFSKHKEKKNKNLAEISFVSFYDREQYDCSTHHTVHDCSIVDDTCGMAFQYSGRSAFRQSGRNNTTRDRVQRVRDYYIRSDSVKEKKTFSNTRTCTYFG